jgi:hypothetical protein
MNLALKIQMDWKRNSKILSSTLLFSPVILNEPMNLGVNLPRTLKRHKPLIGGTFKYM